MVALVVVDVDPEVAVERLVEQRGMREDDARARMANQVAREDRLAKADFVIDNSGTVEDLSHHIEALWPRLLALGSDE
jgi:dephospho-CoA kinase